MANINSRQIHIPHKNWATLPRDDASRGERERQNYSEIERTLNPQLGPWTDYTPALTSTGTQPTMLAANRQGRFIQIGQICHVRIYCTWTNIGTTEAIGTGQYFFSLPVPGRSSYIQYETVGTAYFNQFGVRAWVGMALFVSATARELVGLYLEGGNVAGSGTPVATANSQFYSFDLTYEVA